MICGDHDNATTPKPRSDSRISTFQLKRIVHESDDEIVASPICLDRGSTVVLTTATDRGVICERPGIALDSTTLLTYDIVLIHAMGVALDCTNRVLLCSCFRPYSACCIEDSVFTYHTWFTHTRLREGSAGFVVSISIICWKLL